MYCTSESPEAIETVDRYVDHLYECFPWRIIIIYNCIAFACILYNYVTKEIMDLDQLLGVVCKQYM